MWYILQMLSPIANPRPNNKNTKNEKKIIEIARTDANQAYVHLFYRANGFANDESSLIHYLICLTKTSRLSIRFCLIWMHCIGPQSACIKTDRLYRAGRPGDRQTARQTGNRATHSNECACSHTCNAMQIITRETVYTDLFAYLHSINVKR